MQETTPTNEEQSTSSTTAIATAPQPEDNNIDIVEDIADTTEEEDNTSPNTAIVTVSQPEDNNIDIAEDIADITEEEDNYRCTYNSKRSRRSSDQIKIMIFHNEDEAKKFLLKNDNLLSFSCSSTDTSTASNATQSIPKKEGKIKKVYNKAKELFNKVLHSKLAKDAKKALVDKLKTGIKTVLGSDIAKNFEKQILEHGKEFTKKIGNALINKGVVILAGSAIAGK